MKNHFLFLGLIVFAQSGLAQAENTTTRQQTPSHPITNVPTASGAIPAPSSVQLSTVTLSPASLSAGGVLTLTFAGKAAVGAKISPYTLGGLVGQNTGFIFVSQPTICTPSITTPMTSQNWTVSCQYTVPTAVPADIYVLQTPQKAVIDTVRSQTSNKVNVNIQSVKIQNTNISAAPQLSTVTLSPVSLSAGGVLTLSFTGKAAVGAKISPYTLGKLVGQNTGFSFIPQPTTCTPNNTMPMTSQNWTVSCQYPVPATAPADTYNIQDTQKAVVDVVSSLTSNKVNIAPHAVTVTH